MSSPSKFPLLHRSKKHTAYMIFIATDVITQQQTPRPAGSQNGRSSKISMISNDSPYPQHHQHPHFRRDISAIPGASDCAFSSSPVSEATSACSFRLSDARRMAQPTSFWDPNQRLISIDFQLWALTHGLAKSGSRHTVGRKTAGALFGVEAGLKGFSSGLWHKFLPDAQETPKAFRRERCKLQLLPLRPAWHKSVRMRGVEHTGACSLCRDFGPAWPPQEINAGLPPASSCQGVARLACTVLACGWHTCRPGPSCNMRSSPHHIAAHVSVYARIAVNRRCAPLGTGHHRSCHDQISNR